MKVRDLIPLLQRMDPELPVYVPETDGRCGCQCREREYSEAHSAYKGTEIRPTYAAKPEPQFTTFEVCRIQIF